MALKSISHKKRGNDEFSLIISVFYVSDIEQCTDAFLMCGVQRAEPERTGSQKCVVKLNPTRFKKGIKYR